MPNDAVCRQLVTLEVSRPSASLPAELLPVVEPVLYSSDRAFRTDKTGRVRSKVTRKRLWQIDDNEPDCLWISQASVPAVESRLRDAGYDVEIVDRTPRRPALGSPNLELLGQVQPCDRAMLEMVCTQPCGIIGCGNKCKPLAACARIAQLYPSANILIAVANREAQRVTVERLRDRVPTIRAQSDGHPIEAARVVGTYGDLTELPPQEHEWDVVLFADARSCIKKSVREWDRAMWTRHCYAFHPLLWHPDSQEQWFLQTFFGPYVYDWVNPRHGRVRLRECTCTVRGCELDQPAKTSDQKRARIWRNARLNEAIAGLASALTARHPVQVDEEEIDTPAMQDYGAAIALVVESPEHASALSSLLPDWYVLTREHVTDIGVDTLAKSLLFPLRIVTLAAAVAAPCLLATARAVVDATFDDADLGIPRFPGKVRPGGLEEIRLIKVK